MKVDPDGGPKVEPSARGLGVRVGRDVPDARKIVPGHGGMSVSPRSIWNVPAHRRPRRLGLGSTGPDSDRVYVIAQSAIENHGLRVRLDPKVPEVHGFIEPSNTEPTEAYLKRVAATRSDWRNGEP